MGMESMEMKRMELESMGLESMESETRRAGSIGRAIGRLSIAALVGLAACGSRSVEPESKIDFRDSDGPPRGGGWYLNNGLFYPEVDVLDPDYALNTVAGLDGDDLTTEGRRDTAQYAVECALSDEQSVTKVIDGEDVVLHGALGLASEWYDGTCDEDCQQWVSACLLARTNVTGLAGVEVVLWIDDPASSDDPDPDYEYEGAFFGNLWEESDGYVCQEVSATVSSITALRLCNPATGCLLPASHRYTSCHGLTSRCDDESGTPHSHDCRAGIIVPSGDEYNTVNVYIESDLLEDLEEALEELIEELLGL